MARLAGVRRIADTALGSYLLRRKGVQVGRGVQLHGLPIVTSRPGASLILGDRAVLVSTSRSTALGVRTPVILRCLTEGAEIRIGDDCGLSGTVICAAVRVSIGKRCLIGADCMIFDTDFHNARPENRRYSPPDWAKISAPVTIEDDVFIGTRATILKGVTIGRGSIIAAGSLVAADVAPCTVVGGSPARVIRHLDPAP